MLKQKRDLKEMEDKNEGGEKQPIGKQLASTYKIANNCQWADHRTKQKYGKEIKRNTEEAKKKMKKIINEIYNKTEA